MRGKLVEIAGDDSAEARYFREVFALAGETEEQALLEVGGWLQELRLISPSLPEELVRDRFDLRSILIGDRLVRLFSDFYPHVMLKSASVKQAEEMSSRCAIGWMTGGQECCSSALPRTFSE